MWVAEKSSEDLNLSQFISVETKLTHMPAGGSKLAEWLVVVIFVVFSSNCFMIPTHMHASTHTYLVECVCLSLKIDLVGVPLGEFPAICSIFLAAHINFTTFVDCATVTVASHPIDKRDAPQETRAKSARAQRLSGAMYASACVELVVFLTHRFQLFTLSPLPWHVFCKFTLIFL